MKRIFLDYASTTPIKPEVLKVMEETFRNVYGNAGSLHIEGQKAIAIVDNTREMIAKAVGVEFRGVIFTGSATEANNLALRGCLVSSRKYQISSIKDHREKNKKPRIIISAVEHESVLETARDLEREGAELVILPVNKEGIVDLKKLRELLNERTVLVSVMYVNNEIGTIQPISAIAEVISNWKLEISKKNQLPITDYHFPLLHTDAVQAFQYLPSNIRDLGVDFMTISAHKMYGPKGIGALVIGARREALGVSGRDTKTGIFLESDAYSLMPIITGGGQEFGLRSGTENVPLIAGFAKAVELADKNREKEAKRISGLKEYFWRGIKKLYPSAVVNGSDFTRVPPPDNSIELSDTRKKAGSTHSARFPRQGSGQAGQANSPQVAPHILNVRFPGVSAEEFLIKLDMFGVAVSAGSACSMRSAKPSHVLEAIGLTPKQTKESLRFSFGAGTTKKEINEVLSRVGTKV